jgi:DNA polymerase I-like protein with 3'-5' exonuclease and polymerase domains
VPRFREFKYDSWAEWTYEKFRSDADVNPTGMMVAVDTETSGVGFYDEPFAATLTWRSPEGSLRSGYFDLEGPGRERRIQLLRNILDGLATGWVFHNAKFDLQKLVLVGALDIASIARKSEGLHDTQTIYVLIDENGRKGLKHLAATVLKVDDTIEVEIKSGPNKGEFKRVPKEEHKLGAVRRKLGLKKADGYHLLPREVLVPYALKDTEFTLLLWEKLLPQLEALGDERLMALYREFMQLKLVLLDMEADSFKLDIPYLDCITSEYGVKVMEGWERIVKLTGNPDLNPQSPDQIKATFAKRGVKVDSTAVDVLRDLDDELAEALLQYRSDKKTHTTYLVALKHEQRNGYVHPNFNDDAARTGRMSSSAASNN